VKKKGTRHVKCTATAAFLANKHSMLVACCLPFRNTVDDVTGGSCLEARGQVKPWDHSSVLGRMVATHCPQSGMLSSFKVKVKIRPQQLPKVYF